MKMYQSKLQEHFLKRNTHVKKLKSLFNFLLFVIASPSPDDMFIIPVFPHSVI